MTMSARNGLFVAVFVALLDCARCASMAATRAQSAASAPSSSPPQTQRHLQLHSPTDVAGQKSHMHWNTVSIVAGRRDDAQSTTSTTTTTTRPGRLDHDQYIRWYRSSAMLALLSSVRTPGYYEPYFPDGGKIFYNITENRDCFSKCLTIFSDYGRICAFRLEEQKNVWKYRFKNFNNMCELQDENCRQLSSSWTPLFSGGCPDSYLHDNALFAYTTVPRGWTGLTARDASLLPGVAAQLQALHNKHPVKSFFWTIDLDNGDLPPDYKRL